MLSNTAIPNEYGAFRDRVIRGEIPVCREISLQMNLIDAMITNPAFYYDDSAIDGFIRFCENELTLTDGSPLKLLTSFKLWAEDLLAWFYFAEVDYFNQATGRFEPRVVKRRLRNRQFLILGRGGAKSMYAACIQAYFLTVDTSTTQQFVIAPTMRQAEETLSPIRTAIARHPGPFFKFMTTGSKLSTNELTKQKLASTKKGIENFMTNSIVEIRPMSVDKLQGARSKINTIDEWLSGDTKEDVFQAVEQGASKYSDWVVLAISSEGTVRDSVGDTIKMELQSILRGEYSDPHTSIWYYKLDDVREVGDPSVWMKANPNLGVTVEYETYRREVRRAEAQPSTRSDMLAKRFGIPVEGFTYFFTYEETLPHRPQSFDGMACSMGADLSQGDDFCAFTFMFPLGGEKFGVKTLCFVSENKVLRLPKAMQNKYKQFEAEGSLVIMSGGILNMMDVYDIVDQHILEHRYAVLSFGYDPYNAKEFVERYATENGPFGIEKVIQGVRTESVPLGELKNLAGDRNLIFDQELMKFAMGNSIALEDNNGNRKLSKRRIQEKIDAVAAMLDGWVAYKRHQEVFA